MIYRFGQFELDVAQQRLTKAGDDVQIQQKALVLLSCLLQHRNRNVSKEEIQDVLWPNSIVTEAALTRAVMKARKALDDDAAQQQWIKTVHGHGYRFAGEVTQFEASAAAVTDSATHANLATATDAQSASGNPGLDPDPRPVAPQSAEVIRLRRQNMVRTLAAYGAFAWLLNQGAAVVWEAFEWPRWSQQVLLIGTLAAAVPVAIIAWLFLATGTGLKRPEELSSEVRRLLKDRWLSTTTVLMLLAALSVSLYWNLADNPLRVTSAGEPTIPARLAVLPFGNQTTNPELDHFADGLADTLLTELASLQGLQIAARTSAFQFRHSQAGHKEIAQTLGATYLVEGSVQSTDQNIRVQLGLVSARTGTRVWSQRFDRPAADLFRFQDDVSRAVAAALVKQLPDLAAEVGARVASLSTPQRTQNLQAYQNYLAGSAALRERTKASLQQAQHLFTTALEQDPAYASAWADLARTHFTLATWGIQARAQGMANARRAAETAIGYDPRLARAYLTLADVQSRYEWHFDQAIASMQTAVTLAPGNADVAAVHGNLLSKLGQQQQAVAEVERAWELDPLNASTASSLTTRYTRTGQLQLAERALAQLLALAPDHPDQHWLRAQLALAGADYERALAAIENDELLHLRLSVSAIALHFLGRFDESERTLQELVSADGEGSAFQIAEVYAQREDASQCLAWLETAYAARDPGLGELLSSMAFRPLYNDPKFTQFAAKLGLATHLQPLTASNNDKT